MTTNDLPTRPKLTRHLPVLRRGPGVMQIGLDPRHATVVSGVPDGVVEAARSLNSARPTAELLRSVRPAERGPLKEVLRALMARGLVEDVDRAPPPDPAASVEIRGDGRLAIALACQLAATGTTRVAVTTTGDVVPEHLGTGLLDDDVGRPRQLAVRDAVRRMAPDVDTTPFGNDDEPDLVVVTDAVVPAPELVAELTEAGVPYLLVRVREGHGIIGPLVVHGLTSCLSCADLHRTDLDSCWPLVATQLAGQVLPNDLPSVQATAALAVGQVRQAGAWIHAPTPDAPPTCNASVELDPATATISHRIWQPHPWCSCGAAARWTNALNARRQPPPTPNPTPA